MYSIVLKGCFEVEDVDNFLKEIEEIANKYNATLSGKFVTYKLAPYIDYQEIDASNT